MNKILILGGYGNFGRKITEALLKEKIPVVIAGRSIRKASQYKENLTKTYEDKLIQIAKIDVNEIFTDVLDKLRPIAVVNTCGPFQTANYNVVQQCINSNTNYIDLADGRNFVRNISQFNQVAEKKGISIISGASTVPCLSSAVIEKYKEQFNEIDSIIQGISPGQKTNRGDIATIKGVMSYIGKPFAEIKGDKKIIYGWQDLYRVKYPVIGTRLFCNCQVPDFDVLASKYQIKNVRFSAGTESYLLHMLIWMVSWLIRLGLPINLSNHASLLLYISHLFDFLGTKDGGMHIFIKGKNLSGQNIQRKWFIIAKNADGPHIPSIPAIILAKKFAKSQKVKQGAYPCVGVVSLQQYLTELKGKAIQTYSYLK